MKYILRAIIHEAVGYLCFFGFLAAIGAAFYGLYALFGDATPAVLLLVLFLVLQGGVIYQRAKYEKLKGEADK